MKSFSALWVSVCLIVFGLLAGTASATITIATVHVGDPGNVGELSGASVGLSGYGPDRVCGSVGYTYNIGRYEVTAGQYVEFLNKMAGTDTYGLYSTYMSNTTYGSGITRNGGGTAGNPYTYTVASAFINRPVNYVTFWGACRFANWLNNDQPTGNQSAGTTETGAYALNGYNGTDGRTIQRNPACKWAVASEDEWYKAAYYKSGSINAGYWKYPTRNDTAPGLDVDDVSGNNANSRYNPDPNKSPYYTTVVGEFQNSPSAYGTFDQGGNVWEWNDTVVSISQGYADRGARGGGFDLGTVVLQASYRGESYPTFLSYRMGFRVVYLPEPATLSLFALASVALIRRRKA